MQIGKKNLDKFKNIKWHKGKAEKFNHLKKIKFDQEFRLINHSGNHYLLVHQYDKRWNEFSDNVKKFKNSL